MEHDQGPLAGPSRDYNRDSTAIRLRSDYDVSRAPATIRRDSTRTKNERQFFVVVVSYRSRIAIVIVFTRYTAYDSVLPTVSGPSLDAA